MLLPQAADSRSERIGEKAYGIRQQPPRPERFLWSRSPSGPPFEMRSSARIRGSGTCRRASSPPMASYHGRTERGTSVSQQRGHAPLLVLLEAVRRSPFVSAPARPRLVDLHVHHHRAAGGKRGPLAALGDAVQLPVPGGTVVTCEAVGVSYAVENSC